MTTLVLGKTGQVALALNENRTSRGRVEFLSRAQADFSRPLSLRDLLRDRKPSLVINAAAYTAVDLAESEPELAVHVNAEAPGILAATCQELGATLIHYSTDYVFPGTGVRAWREVDPIEPLSTYGRTKAEGERRIRESGVKHLIFRTSWVYSHTGRNFVRTMLKLGAEREQLKVVSDQIGAPTYARDLAKATWKCIEIFQPELSGTYHLTAQGETSWHGFAATIFEEALSLEFSLKVKSLVPIPTAEYPTPAVRPLNSRLDNRKVSDVFGVCLPDWRVSLRDCLVRIRKEEISK